ncbi:uncharacterized protein [Macrobrachium rosenbergii]|uniref:uncharacterized protein n=1 Tax=Macrobrachium rosenbergii TaxID=79674 RepID=UPI0034D67A1A
MDSQASSSVSDLSPKDLGSLKYNHFVRKYGKKTFHLVMMRLVFPCGQHKRIHEILIDLEVPLQGKKSPFSAQEAKNITDKLPEDLDITVINKILQALWQKKVNDPGDDLKGLLKKTKDERNFVSHEEPYMSDTDLESRLRDFQATLKETLEKTKSLFPKHSAAIDQLKAEIQGAVPKTLEKIREKYDLSNPHERQRFTKEIEEYGSELSDMIQESSEAELLSLNERLCRILPYDWLEQYDTTDPGNIMVCLQVADDQESNKDPHGNKSIIVNQKEIFNIKDPMGKDPEVVIISGDAGSGKTTILCSYAEGWCKKTMDMPELSSFPLLLHMQFRNDEHDNFDDYLKSLIPKTVARFPFDLVKSVVLGSKCLVLCDGYDEANINSRKLSANILALNSNKMKFVVTTRPGNTKELTKILNKAKRSRINLKVSGLQEEDMKLLTEKLIGHLVKHDDVTQQEQMKKELLQKIAEMDTGTRAILQTPLYFNLFILLYIECPELRDEMSTRTSVYLQLEKHKIKRISDKTGISEESLKEFDALYRKWSLKHYTEEKYEWSEADIRSFKDDIAKSLQEENRREEVLQNFEAIMSSYFSIKKTKKHLEIVKVYCHRHRSEQEFAAAGSICDDIITSSGRPRKGNIIRDIITSSGRPRRGNIIRNIITSIRRPPRGNIVRDVLLSKGLWDGSDLKQLFRKFEVIPFITGILYSAEREVLYDTIEDIHELYVSYSLSIGCKHDPLLGPCIETRVDHKVLESLVSQMERKTSLKNRVRFEEPMSLYVLPSLLPKLRPKEIELSFSHSEVPRDLSQLNKTLESASQSNVHTKIDIWMWLRDYAQLSEQKEVLHPVDKLYLVIGDDGRCEDLESLRPASLLTSSAKELRLEFSMADAPEGRLAKVINRTLVPTSRKEGGITDLWIHFWRDRDLKLLLQSLTVPPLRSITLSNLYGKKIDDAGYVEELKTLCREKGLGKLRSNLWTDTEEEKEKKRKR